MIFRPWRRGLALAAALAAGVASVAIPGAATAESSPQDGWDSGGTSTSVTLITGDRVTATTTPDGRRSFSVTPLPGAEREVAFLRSELNGDTYLVPSDVAPLTGTLLDRELFNVTGLLRDGYSDERTDSLPLIVQRSAAAPLARSETPLRPVRELPAIGAAAAVVDKSATVQLGRALAGDTGAPAARSATGPLAGIQKVWLDGRVKAVALDANLPQIGAPAAWAAGNTGKGVKVAVLDTGVDVTHPDLAGRVSTAEDFTGSASGTADRVGHGTHVSATVAGSGAGAPGLRSGVAPEADLIVGKVLDDTGYGTDSQVLAGMEWAVRQGARVVNMSLGSGPTDGTDVISTALNTLSRSSGALFVVSAGNDGPGVSTVSAPSVADEALSVAAVDASNVVASFSSRGPRIGGGIKPEIAAPGVSIVAARATGVTGGGVDPRYLSMSGTSMAAPHVAGAAAILAQVHPDWTGQQLKRALMNTAKPLVQSVEAVGAGVVDISKATTQTLFADTGAIDFGAVPAGAAPITRTVTVTNTGTTEVVANVAARLSTSLTGPSPVGLVTVSPSTVRLGAGESAEVTVTVDPAGTTSGMYSGEIKIEPQGAPNAFLRLPMVLDRSEVVRVSVLGGDGGPVRGALVLLTDLDAGGVTRATTGADGTVSVRLNPGRYAAVSVAYTVYPEGPALAMLTADKPADSHEIVLDARNVRPYSLGVAGEDLRQDFLNGNLIRKTVAGANAISYGVIAGGAYGAFDPTDIRITPDTGLTPGTVALSEHWRLADAASDHETGDTSVQYDLAFVRDGVAEQPVVLTAEEKAKLARIDVTWKGMGEPQRIQEGSVPYLDGGVGLNYHSPSFLTLPQRRTEYVTGGEVDWLSYTYRNKDGLQFNFDSVHQRYEIAGRLTETWYGGPYRTRSLAQVWRDAMQFRVVDGVDSDGRYGRYSDYRYPTQSKRSLTITRNGGPVSLKSVGIDTFELALPDREAARYEITRTFSAANGFPLGGEGTATWRFTATGGAAEPTAVAVPDLRYDVALDDLNRASAGRPLPIAVTTSGLTGRVVDAGAEYTTDGGATWHPVRAAGGGDGRYELVVPASALVAGDYLGLRFVVTDEAGNSVDMVLPRAVLVA